MIRSYWAWPRSALAVVLACSLGVLATMVLPGPAAALMSDLTQLSAAAIAAVTTLGFARASAGRRLRIAWASLSAACASWAAGQAYWTVLAVQGSEPFPSLADVGFLGFSVLAVIALVVHPASGGRIGRLQRTFDAVMTTGAVGLVGWQTALGVVLRNDTGHGVGPRLLLAAYPVGDIVLVVLAVLLIIRTAGDRRPLNLVALGVTALAVADSAFTYLAATSAYDGGTADAGWTVAFVLIAVAGLARQQSVESDREEAHNESGGATVAASLLPYVPVIIALGAALAQSLTGAQLGRGEELVVALVISMVMARQYMTVQENVRLAASLASREAELRHLAFRDPLTGLANRALFIDRLDHAMALHARDLRPVSLVFIDLDGFKLINDTLGHAAGDDLLVRVAERLTGALRGGDTVARLGGDEFAVLLEDGGDVADGATRIGAALSTPFVVGGVTLPVSASVGVCALNPSDAPVSADELLARADAAMYAAKRAGGGRVARHPNGSAIPVPARSAPGE